MYTKAYTGTELKLTTRARLKSTSGVQKVISSFALHNLLSTLISLYYSFGPHSVNSAMHSASVLVVEMQ